MLGTVEGANIKISRQFFLSYSAEKIRRGFLQCFINFGCRKFMDKMGEGVSRFSVEFFLSHSAEIFRRGNL